MKFLVLLCLFISSCCRHENVVVAEKTLAVDPNNTVASIPMNRLPDWVADPTQGGKYKGSYGYAVKNPSSVDQNAIAMDSARKRFSVEYIDINPDLPVMISRHTDPGSGTLFVWIVIR